MKNVFQKIYNERKVLVTGHTGFKGSWLSLWLNELGADVIGFSLEKYPNEYIFNNSKLKEEVKDIRGDIRDLEKLKEVFKKHKPEIVFHMAAQPLVRDSYDNPHDTFTTNIIGTMNILECIKESGCVKAAVIITTDKCYKNKEKEEGYHEDDELGGHDPYSASKACAEIITSSYRSSFFKTLPIATVRAGNVIGGGDYSKDRLVPDCIKSLKKGKDIIVRNPNSTRPWQYVVEPISGYLMVGEKLLEGKKEFAEAWNFGPEIESVISVKELAEKIIKHWGSGRWTSSMKEEEHKHETVKLNLNISKAKHKLPWKPRWGIDKTIEKTVDWYKRSEKEDIYDLCVEQISEYEKELSK